MSRGPGNLFDPRDDDDEPLFDSLDDEPNAAGWDETVRAIAARQTADELESELEPDDL